MKDVYLERKDQEIEKLKDDYWRVREGGGEAILFDMLVKIDDKATYIAEHPERAKNHYSKSRDAAFVKSVRTSLGLTQEAFGYRLGVSREIVNRWEKGRVPLSEDKRILIESVMRFADPNPSWKKDIINSLWRGV